MKPCTYRTKEDWKKLNRAIKRHMVPSIAVTGVDSKSLELFEANQTKPIKIQSFEENLR